MKMISRIRKIGLLLLLLPATVICMEEELILSLSLSSSRVLNFNVYREYGIEIVRVPEFLRSHIVEEFTTALEEKGLTRNDNENALKVRIIYKTIRLDAIQADTETSVDRDSIESEDHYREVISIDLIDTHTGSVLIGGEISRILSISPLDYHLEDRQEHDFLEVFRKFLAAFPGRGVN